MLARGGKRAVERGDLLRGERVEERGEPRVVHLVVGGERERVRKHERVRRHHVRGEAAAGAAHARRGGRRGVRVAAHLERRAVRRRRSAVQREVRDELARGERAVVEVLDVRVEHARLARELRGDLVQLHALPVDLDLATLGAAEALDLPVAQQAAAVARAVHALAAGQRGELGRGELGRTDVPVAELRPGERDLAHRARIHALGAAGGEHVERRGRVHLADDAAPRVGVDEAERVADGRLGRAVGVDQPAGHRAPGVQHAVVDHVAAAEQPGERRRVLRAHHARERRGQHGDRDAEPVQCELQVGEQLLPRRGGDGKAAGQRQAHLAERHVKARRRQLQEPRGARRREHGAPREQHARNGAVADLHALGLARAAAGEQDGRRRGERRRRRRRRRRRLGTRGGACDQLLQAERVARVAGEPAVGEQRAGPDAPGDHLDHVCEALRGQRRVQRHVRLVSLPGGEQGHVERHAARQVHKHRPAAHRAQPVGERVAGRVQLGVAERLRGERLDPLRKHQRGRLRRLRGVRAEPREERVVLLGRRGGGHRGQQGRVRRRAVQQAEHLGLHLAHEQRRLPVGQPVHGVHELQREGVRPGARLERHGVAGAQLVLRAGRRAGRLRVRGEEGEEHVKEGALEAQLACDRRAVHKLVLEHAGEVRVRLGGRGGRGRRACGGRVHACRVCGGRGRRTPPERHRRDARAVHLAEIAGCHDPPAEHQPQRDLLLAHVLRKQRGKRGKHKRMQRHAARLGERLELGQRAPHLVGGLVHLAALALPPAHVRERGEHHAVQLALPERLCALLRAGDVLRKARKGPGGAARRRRAAQPGVHLAVQHGKRHGVVHGVVQAHTQRAAKHGEPHRRALRELREDLVRNRVARLGGARSGVVAHVDRRRLAPQGDLHEPVLVLAEHAPVHRVRLERGRPGGRRALRVLGGEAHVVHVEPARRLRERLAEHRLLQRHARPRVLRGAARRLGQARDDRGATRRDVLLARHGRAPGALGARGGRRDPAHGGPGEDLGGRHRHAALAERMREAHRGEALQPKAKEVRLHANVHGRAQHVLHGGKHRVLLRRAGRRVGRGAHQRLERLCRVQLGKRAGVHLGRDAGEREEGERHQHARHHVRRERLAQRGMQLVVRPGDLVVLREPRRRVVLGHVRRVRGEGDQARVGVLRVREQQRGGVQRRGAAGGELLPLAAHRGVHLVQLHARAAHLHLRGAHAAEVLGLVRGAEPCHVARRVRRAAAPGEEGRALRLLALHVPAADVAADDAQLAGLAAQREAPLLPGADQHHELVPRERGADAAGQRRRPHTRGRDADRRLGRAVRIEHRDAGLRAPGVHHVLRQLLAADGERAERRHVRRRDAPPLGVEERRHHTGVRHAARGDHLAEVLQQHGPRHRHDRRAGLERDEALAQVHVERLCGAREEPEGRPGVARGHRALERALQVVDRRGQVAVREDAALGLARAPRRVEDVRHVVGVHRGVGGRRGAGGAGAGRHERLHALRRAHSPVHACVLRRGHYAGRLAVLHEQLLPRRGQRLVQGEVHEPSAQDAQQAHVRLGAARQIDAHHGVRRAAGAQGAGKRGARRVQLRVRARRAVRGAELLEKVHRDRVGAPVRPERAPLRHALEARRRRGAQRRLGHEACVAEHALGDAAHALLAVRGVRGEERVQLRQEQLRVRRRDLRGAVVERQDEAPALEAHLDGQRVLYLDAHVAPGAERARLRGRLVVHLEEEHALKQRALPRAGDLLPHEWKGHRGMVQHRAVERLEACDAGGHRRTVPQVHGHRERGEQRAADVLEARIALPLRHDVAQQHALCVHVRGEHAGARELRERADRCAVRGGGLLERRPGRARGAHAARKARRRGRRALGEQRGELEPVRARVLRELRGPHVQRGALLRRAERHERRERVGERRRRRRGAAAADVRAEPLREQFERVRVVERVVQRQREERLPGAVQQERAERRLPVARAAGRRDVLQHGAVHLRVRGAGRERRLPERRRVPLPDGGHVERGERRVAGVLRRRGARLGERHKARAQAREVRRGAGQRLAERRGIRRRLQRIHAVHPVPARVHRRLEEHALLQRGHREHLRARRAERREDALEVRAVRGVHRAEQLGGASGALRRGRLRVVRGGEQLGERVVALELRGRDGRALVGEARGELHGADRVEAQRGEGHVRRDALRRHAAQQRDPGTQALGERRGERGVRGAGAVGGHLALPGDHVQLAERGAHRAAVDLGARGAREAREHHKVRRHHVRREQLLRAGAQLAGDGERLGVGAQHAARAAGHHDKRDDARLVAGGAGQRHGVRVLHRGGHALDRGVDLEQLDAHPVDLDLVVVAPEVLDLAVCQHAHQVARAVHAAELGVRHEPLRGLVRVADVAARELRAREQQLADRAAGHRAEVRVHRDAPGRGERHADVVRLHLVVLPQGAHRHRERRLGGAIDVHQPAPLRPLVRDHLGELFAAVDHHAHARHRGARHHGRHGRSKERVGHLQRVCYPHQPGEQQLQRRKAHRAAVAPRVKDVKDRQVEHVGGELEEAHLAGRRGAERGGHRRLERPHPLHGGAVRDADRLGQARRAACPDLVRERRGAPRRLRQHRRGRRALLDAHDPHPRRRELAERRGGRVPGGEHRHGAGLGEQRALPLRGPLGVDRAPRGAGARHAEDRRVHVGRLVQAERHDRVVRRGDRRDARAVQQERGDLARARLELRVRPGLDARRRVVRHRRAARERGDVRLRARAAQELVLEPLALEAVRRVDVGLHRHRLRIRDRPQRARQAPRALHGRVGRAQQRLEERLGLLQLQERRVVHVHRRRRQQGERHGALLRVGDEREAHVRAREGGLGAAQRAVSRGVEREEHGGGPCDARRLARPQRGAHLLGEVRLGGDPHGGDALHDRVELHLVALVREVLEQHRRERGTDKGARRPAPLLLEALERRGGHPRPPAGGAQPRYSVLGKRGTRAGGEPESSHVRERRACHRGSFGSTWRRRVLREAMRHTELICAADEILTGTRAKSRLI